MVEKGEKLGPRAGAKGLLDVSELPGIVVAIKLSRRSGGVGTAIVADAIIPYPEHFNKDGEDMVYELKPVKRKYQDELLKNQIPHIEVSKGTRPLELAPLDGPPELSFPRGVLGSIIVSTIVVSKSALLGAKDESQKRKAQARKSAAASAADLDAEDDLDETPTVGGALQSISRANFGSTVRATAGALARLLPPSWTNNPAVVLQVADAAANLMLEQAVEWLLFGATGDAMSNAQRLHILNLERVRCSEKTLKGLCVSFAGHLRDVSLKSCTFASDPVILYLSEVHHGTLQALNVMHCYRISDQSLTVMANCCSQLQDLNISDTSQYGTTDGTVAAACRCCQLLRNFQLADLSLVTDSSVATALTLPLLNTLDVSGCKRISDGMFQQLFHLFPGSSSSQTSLRSIKLACCNVSDQVLFESIVFSFSPCNMSPSPCGCWWIASFFSQENLLEHQLCFFLFSFFPAEGSVSFLSFRCFHVFHKDCLCMYMCM